MKSINVMSLLVFCLFMAIVSPIFSQQDCPRSETRLVYDSTTNTYVITNIIIPCGNQILQDSRDFEGDKKDAPSDEDISVANPHVDPDEIQLVIEIYMRTRIKLMNIQADLAKLEAGLAELRLKSQSPKKVYAAETKLYKLYAAERKLSADLNFLSETLFISYSNLLNNQILAKTIDH